MNAKEISFEQVKEREDPAQIDIIEEIVEEKPSICIQEEIHAPKPEVDLE